MSSLPLQRGGVAKDDVNVQVVVRCRPLNGKERSQQVQSVVSCTNKHVSIEDKGQNFKKYAFDQIFGPDSTQEAVFDTAIKPFVENVLDGFNCTIFAYGQTGTGKTYTMAGESGEVTPDGALPEEAGIIPRTVNRVFEKLQGSDSTVTVNFLELYNEELTDLLDPCLDKDGGSRKKKIMRIMEEQTSDAGPKLRRGIQLTPYPEDCVVTNAHEILQILERGTAQRQTAETLLNEKSSRSHSILVINITIKETKASGEDVIKIGKLNLVDLAGSENVSRAGSNRREDRQREASNINQSLLTLGRVINALVDKTPHVPYRDSNLTRLLRDSLGGATKTLMIATISAGDCSQEETSKTLDYANRAKSIKNRPEVNQRISKTDLVKDLHTEIKRLKEELLCQRRKEGVIVLPLERHAQNEADRKSMLKELDEARDQIKALQKQNGTVLAENQELRENWSKAREASRDQSSKLKDQEYWREMYQKNCEELTAQLKTQACHITRTEQELVTHKRALQSVTDKLQTLALHTAAAEAATLQHVQITTSQILQEAFQRCAQEALPKVLREMAQTWTAENGSQEQAPAQSPKEAAVPSRKGPENAFQSLCEGEQLLSLLQRIQATLTLTQNEARAAEGESLADLTHAVAEEYVSCVQSLAHEAGSDCVESSDRHGVRNVSAVQNGASSRRRRAKRPKPTPDDDGGSVAAPDSQNG